MKVIRKTGFANVGRKYKSKKQVRNNMQRCYAAAPDADWSHVEINEKDPVDELDIAKSIYGPSHKLYGLWGNGITHCLNAIRNNKDRRSIGRKPIKGCSGIERWSPARWIVETITTDNDFTIPVVVAVTHFARPGRKDADKARAEHFKKLKERAAYWVDQRGYVYEIKMDFNGTNAELVKSVHPNARIMVDAGIDYIVVIAPDDIKVRRNNIRQVPMNIDGHNGHILSYSLETK